MPLRRVAFLFRLYKNTELTILIFLESEIFVVLFRININMEKLKQRWGIDSNFQIVVIFIVFAITGSTASWVTKPILDFLGISREAMNPFLYWFLRIVLILPVYKLLLLFFGTVFGQRLFFWNFVKKMLQRMGFSFLYR